MLREETTRLLAAFDHRDIFIDPDPDPKKAFAERQRLFALPRSSWQDYDKALISKGGGVYPRASKEIKLSEEAQKLLGVGASVTPQELMKAILKAEVDLLFFGGIGTYVRASHETDEQVGDRANDSIRVTGGDLRCKVVGEGANLGMTQRGRIEAAVKGVRLNTDAIDNSGGVDTSDHEVNIKILLDLLVKKGIVPNKEARNRMLAEMEGDVAALVLEDNRNQARALTLDGLRSAAHYDEFVDLVGNMERNGMIDRSGVQLPSRDSLLQSPQKARGLPRPLLDDLLGYAKMWFYEKLVRSSLPDNPVAGGGPPGHITHPPGTAARPWSARQTPLPGRTGSAHVSHPVVRPFRPPTEGCPNDPRAPGTSRDGLGQFRPRCQEIWAVPLKMAQEGGEAMTT
jgi:glutamate dehydrogenase